MGIEKRKKQRLQEWIYSDKGSYFLTICCARNKKYLGEIYIKVSNMEKTVGGGVLDAPKLESSTLSETVMELSEIGKIVDAKIQEMDELFNGVHIDNYVIMPNHIHLLLSVDETSGASRTPPPTASAENKLQHYNETVPRFVSYLKRSTNKKCGIKIWQRGYHDHVIRDSGDYNIRWNYIERNPIRWVTDKYHME